MKYIIKALTCLILVSPFVAGVATASSKWSGCAEKEYQIQKQLEYAKAYGNIHRVRGLERALTNVQRYCTDGKLTSEWQEKVADKESKVRERMEELRHAQASGDPEKIRKKEKKLQEAKNELMEVQSGLNQSLTRQ
ncbi:MULTISPECIES: DUF1090 domain-containing protein [Klebsiella]|uniref:DUF1090 domain-containing protein n=1 Tax=Klebsiella TaxID=570 RepID=UPI00062C0D60|nr:DUF1090 domain-containing protein [Klebsiella michiganensis]ELN3894460.1 DUF1090 domain-containing protein [Klebsiella michiganensis]ELS5413751.1 DUF1090 domain-containing protein [Klebsiella michiganensis]MBZ7106715.1 DUF1090 domain-containing protein [Klebsiella michiganensis]MBZ7624282.1 DUF1090 domain-containing protein [Klebsiella michiganensis]MCW9450292.1 DUF1090 domain-containing protein [Klebsiella michiganensis]